MTLDEAKEYIDREWNYPNGVHDYVIPDIPGCARWVVSALAKNPDANVDHLICYWFRNT